MKKLIAFGDSWTHGHGVEDDIAYKEIGRANDFIFTLRMSNSWPRYLAEKLDLPFVNFGYPGSDNIQIANAVDMFFDHLTENDLILIMLSFPYRHAHGSNKHVKVQDIIARFQKKLYGYNYFFLNSFCKTFEFDQDILPTVDLSRFLQVDTCASDILSRHEQEHDTSVWEYGCRKVYQDQSNFKQGDYHPNITGYKLIAEWIFSELQAKQSYISGTGHGQTD